MHPQPSMRCLYNDLSDLTYSDLKWLLTFTTNIKAHTLNIPTFYAKYETYSLSQSEDTEFTSKTSQTYKHIHRRHLDCIYFFCLRPEIEHKGNLLCEGKFAATSHICTLNETKAKVVFKGIILITDFLTSLTIASCNYPTAKLTM